MASRAFKVGGGFAVEGIESRRYVPRMKVPQANWIESFFSYLVSLFTGAVRGQQIEAARNSFQETKLKAEKGDAPAQHSLGEMYEYAEGVGKDAVEAVKWFRKAADQGDVFAQHNLRVMR